MYQRILVPTDGSDCAAKAAEEAVSLADRLNADLHALYAVDVRAKRPNPEVETYTEELKAEGEEALATVEDLASTNQVDIESAIRLGDPRDLITDYADEHDIELIVMGTHGRRGVSRMVLGSITEGVVRLSDTPVLTVPQS